MTSFRTHAAALGRLLAPAGGSGSRSLRGEPVTRSTVTVVGLAVLLSVIALVYWPVLDFGYINADDPIYVFQNPNLRGGLSWGSVWWALTTDYFGWWHPVTWLSHLLDVSLFEFAAGGHHLTSLCLHVLNTALAVGMLRTLSVPPVRALVIAALAMLHPTRVESVAWISERKDVLAMTFFFLTIVFWERYRERDRARWYWASLTALALGLGSKAMLVTTPLLLVLIDRWRGRAFSWWRAVREIGPFLILAGLVSAEILVRQRGIGAVDHVAKLSGLDRMLVVPIAYVKFLKLSFWPVDLSFWTALVPAPPVWVGIGALCTMVGLSWLIWRWRQRMPHLAFGWVWFLVSLLPVAGIVKAGGSVVHDRYLYLPHVGLITGVVLTISVAGRSRQLAAVAVAVGLVLALAARSASQVARWSDPVTLLGSSLEVRPNDRWLLASYGSALQARGRCPEALRPLRAVADEDNRCRSYLGRCLVILGRDSEGLGLLEEARRKDPNRPVLREMYRESLLRAAARASAEGRREDEEQYSAKAAALQR